MIYRWRGITNGTWTTPGNWVNEADTPYSAGYPGSGNDYEDDAYFDAAATTALAGINGTAFGVLRSLRIGAAYNKAFATAGAYLLIPVQDVIIDASSSCPTIYLHTVTDGGWTDGCSRLSVLDAPALYLKGTMQTVTFLRGVITFDETTTIGAALTIGEIDADTDVTLTIPWVTSLPSTINCHSGTITCRKGITTLNVNGGIWTQEVDGTAGHTAEITTLTISGDTTFYWNSDSITTAYLYGGTFTAANGSAPRRIGTIYAFPGSACNLNNGADSILVTSYVRNYGGTITTSTGFDLAPYRNETYAGASDAKYGVSPQTINNTTVNGDAIYIGVQDRLDIVCNCGVIAAGGAVAYTAKESLTSGGTYSAIAGKSASFTDAEDDKTKRITIWGHELTATKRWVRIECAETGIQNALCAAVYVKSTF